MGKEKNKGIILLVDDEKPIREALGELLESCGFVVLLADCYKAAVDVLKGGDEIETVISDLKMPGKSGLEVLKHINQRKLNIPLIFLTGFGTLESCQEAVKEGAFDYILKPIDNKDKVIFPVSHAIEKYRLEQKTFEMRKDIIEMAQEHQQVLDELLTDVELKHEVQKKIGKILDKYEL